MNFMKCIFFMKFHEISRVKKGSPNEMQSLYITSKTYGFAAVIKYTMPPFRLVSSVVPGLKSILSVSTHSMFAIGTAMKHVCKRAVIQATSLHK
jgi:hypothetical protein